MSASDYSTSGDAEATEEMVADFEEELVVAGSLTKRSTRLWITTGRSRVTQIRRRSAARPRGCTDVYNVDRTHDPR
jgi:hypothetical protein